MKLKIFVTMSLLLAIASANSQELTILTEEDPPYSFTEANGQPGGFGVEVVDEIQKRLGSKVFSVEIQPWARLYRTALEKPNIVAFALSRTKEREELFHWVGPIWENDWVLIAPKASKLQLRNLEDAKRLQGIGCVRDYAWTKYLIAQGFNNLQLVKEPKQDALKLRAGRIDVMVGADSTYARIFSQAGLDPDDYEIVLRFNTTQLYIVFSYQTDKTIPATWQAELDRMKKDGTFAKIMNKWLPKRKMLGAARPGTV